MKVAFAFVIALQASFTLSESCHAQVGPGPISAPGSITVSNVAPSGQVKGGQKNTVTANVKVSALPDGTYNVTIVVYCYGPDDSKTTKGTVVVTNGVGTVNVSADFPSASTGQTGQVQVEVQSADSGASDAAESSITYQ